MGKFIKEFIMEIELFKLKSKYNNKLYKYGLIGEERVAYQLKTCDEDILCLYDVILEVNNQRAQYDFLVISRDLVFIIEVKNLLGNIIVKDDGTIERLIYKSGGVEKCGFFNPFIQMEEQEKKLNNFLKENGYLRKIDKILVMANDRTLIYGKKERYNVLKFDQLNKYLKDKIKGKKICVEEIEMGELIYKKTKIFNYQILNVIQKKSMNQYVPAFESFVEKMYYLKIVELRKYLAKKYNMPACNIYNNKEAELLVINKPKTKDEFLNIKGFKNKRYEMFGDDIIKIFKNN